MQLQLSLFPQEAGDVTDKQNNTTVLAAKSVSNPKTIAQ